MEMTIDFLGHWILKFIRVTKDFSRLYIETLIKVLTPPLRPQLIFQQIHFVGIQSLPIIVLCVSFAAVVTILESSFHMKLIIQNDSMVPGFAAVLILREMGAAISALLLTSRVGAGIAAEVGSMKITEQIDALKMLAIDPIKYLVVPRFIACTIGGFLLAIIACIVCLYCAMLVSQIHLNYTMGSFITAMNRFVQFQDLMFAGIKGAVFGSVIPLISCFYGFRCQAGAEGVGHATTRSVVAASVAIIVLDFILSYIFSFFY